MQSKSYILQGVQNISILPLCFSPKAPGRASAESSPKSNPDDDAAGLRLLLAPSQHHQPAGGSRARGGWGMACIANNLTKKFKSTNNLTKNLRSQTILQKSKVANNLKNQRSIVGPGTHSATSVVTW